MEFQRVTSTVQCACACFHLRKLLSITIFCSVERGSQGAWQRFERGELPLFQFYEAFGKDLSDTANGNVWYQDYCKRKGIGGSVTS
jgi:hypothetical protein